MLTVAEMLDNAVQHFLSGRHELAIEFTSQALRTQPTNGDAHSILGVILASQGRLVEAVATFQGALRLKPDDADAHNNLARALLDLGKLEEARDCCQRALRLRPDNADAHNNLGCALFGQGNAEEAIASYEQAVHLRPDYAEAHFNLGRAFQEQGKLEKALASFQETLRFKTNFAEAHNNVGNTLRQQGKFEEAIASYKQALHLQANNAETHNNLGCALLDQRKLEEALTSFQEALRLKPNFADAHYNLGCTYQEQGKLEKALTSFQEAVRLKPGDAEAHNNLGNVLRELGKLEEGLASFQEALRLKPDFAEAHLNLGFALLLMGNLGQGWGAYEWRLKVHSRLYGPFSQPAWQGAPLEGQTILLHSEQGLGDTLQFIRYAPLVKQRGGRVVVLAPEVLLPVLASCPGIDRLLVQGATLPEFDVQAPLLSLPGIFGTTLETMPADVPYLRVNADQIDHWHEKLRPFAGFKVGIAWQGNPTLKKDRYRSIPLDFFAPLANVPGVRLFSLQKGPGTEQLRAVASRFPVEDLGEPNVMNTAAAMMSLDLVITSDTAIAHLAGALGVPVWIALSLVPDWRWLIHREDCPWYPTMRLFRQKRFGDWSEVFARIAAELHSRWRSGGLAFY